MQQKKKTMSLTPTQAPATGATYARNTVPETILSTQVAVTASLWIYGDSAPLFVGSYAPDFSNQVKIDLRGAYETALSTEMPTSNSSEVEQYTHRIKFQLNLVDENSNTCTLIFYVCNSLLKSATAFETWAQSNFLTNQPLEKTTNYEAPEWLTYLDLSKDGNRVLKARFYPKSGGNSDVVVRQDNAIGCYSVDVSFNRIARMSNLPPAAMLGYYDLILFDGNDEVCRQRYIYEERNGREKYFLFVNALGGIDTLICGGENTLQPETTHNIGRFGHQFVALDDTDEVRQWNQEIGMVPYRQRGWIHELLTAKQGAMKYDPELEIYQSVVVTSSEISMGDGGQLAGGTFGYILDEAVNVIADNERPDRSLHQSVADQAEELHDDTRQVVLDFADDGNGGYETEDVEITATKLYVEFDDSITDARTIPVYYYLGGSSTAAGSFTPGTDTSPVVITKAASESIRFASQSNALGSLAVSYYPTTVIID